MTTNTDRYLEALDTMDSYQKFQNDPMVGIFWYDVRNNDLFGVVSEYVSQLKYQSGFQSIDTLHRTIWNKQYNKNKFKNNGKEKYPWAGNYRDTTRGRVFWDFDEKKAVIYVGSWVKDYLDVEELVLIEFGLKNVEYELKVEDHWELGMGYGE